MRNLAPLGVAAWGFATEVRNLVAGISFFKSPKFTSFLDQYMELMLKARNMTRANVTPESFQLAVDKMHDLSNIFVWVVFVVNCFFWFGFWKGWGFSRKYLLLLTSCGLLIILGEIYSSISSGIIVIHTVTGAITAVIYVWLFKSLLAHRGKKKLVPSRRN